MPSPAKRQRADMGPKNATVLMDAMQADAAAPTGQHAHHADVRDADNSPQAQDRVLLEKGDCAAAAPVAA